jgi:hypothetical protein
MLQTITLPRAPESNAIGAWTHQLPEPFPSPDPTAYWLIAGATQRAPWFRSLRAWPRRIGPGRAGSQG